MPDKDAVIFGVDQSNGLMQGGIPAQAGFTVGQILDDNILMFMNEKARFDKLTIGVNSVQSPPNDNPAREANFGTETGFGLRFRELFPGNKRLYCGKHARGGTGIREKIELSFNPFFKDSLFNKIVKPNVRKMFEMLPTDCNIKGACQAIGEEDRTPFDEHYLVDEAQREIIRIFNALANRDRTTDPLRFVMMLLTFKPGDSNAANRVTQAYRDMQQSWADDPSLNVRLVNCDDLVKQNDGIHFVAASGIVLGRRMCDAMYGE